MHAPEKMPGQPVPADGYFERAWTHAHAQSKSRREETEERKEQKANKRLGKEIRDEEEHHNRLFAHRLLSPGSSGSCRGAK